jgi:arsenate reductase
MTEDETMAHTNEERPTLAVLFLCIHNAGRSQMALGWLNPLAGGQVIGYSGGSEPVDQLNPVAVAAMAEVGFDITNETPTRWSNHQLDQADVVVTMGCGDTCPSLPGKRYEDWPLDDPAGLDLAAVRPIRDAIAERVRTLLTSLGVPATEPTRLEGDQPPLP